MALSTIVRPENPAVAGYLVFIWLIGLMGLNRFTITLQNAFIVGWALPPKIDKFSC